MNGAFEIGAAALRAEQLALETHANNVANVNTPAFKRLENRFAEVVAQAGDAMRGEAAGNGAAVAVSSAGVRVSQHPMLFDQGALRTTGNPMHLAIEGRGLVELMGQRGEPLLWRGGSLRVNEDGLLANSDGIALRAAIAVPVDATALRIGRDGVVSATTGDGAQVELGQIGLVAVEHADAVERLDSGLMRLRPDGGVKDIVAGEDGAGVFVQGSIEESNVELTEEMVQVMIVQRAYAANAQIVQAADQIASITNNLQR